VLNTHRPPFSNPRLRLAVNYAIDRRALAPFGSGYRAADTPADQYLPPGIPGFSQSCTYPLEPNLAKARTISSGGGKTAILFTCANSGCRQMAQIVRNDLAGIGLRVEIGSFDHTALYARMARPHEPFDLAFGNWVPDYPDPVAVLNGMLANGAYYPSFDDPTRHTPATWRPYNA
jgi:peptide/nickel transport system substrate-binding protein